MIFEETDGSTKVTVGTILGTEIGKSSGLPIPVIGFQFEERAWYTSDAFISQLADRVPEPKRSYSDKTARKQRERLMKAMLTSTKRLVGLGGTSAFLAQMQEEEVEAKARYWETVQLVLREKGMLDHQAIKLVQHRVNKLLRLRRMRQWRESYGIVQRGKVESGNTEALLPFQPKVMRTLPNTHLSFVPPLDVRRMSQEHLVHLQRVESQLDIVARIRGGVARRDKRDSNRGMSLGLTTVTGGRHSNRNENVSGSLHMNRNLTGLSARVARECAAHGVDLEELQNNVIDIVCNIIEDNFGSLTWYKAAKDVIRNIPEERLLPNGRVPVSHIWHTSRPKAYHVHTDTNTIPPAFLICCTEVEGGELCCLPPTGGMRVVDTKPGTVVGGSWAQYPHCNAPVLEGQRHSFVVYLDNRNVSEKYTVMIDKN